MTVSEQCQSIRPKLSCGVFDAISASIVASFADYLFLSGLALSATQFLELDQGHHSLERVVDLSNRIADSRNGLPIIADIDDCFADYSLAGTVARRLRRASVYGVVIEDQARPRKCGHLPGKKLRPKQEYLDALKRMRDAVPELFIVARSDAESSEDIEERLEMFNSIAEHGLADAYQIDGMASLEQIRYARNYVSDSLALVVNHVDGGRLRVSKLSDLSNVGVAVLTLSTLALSTYLESMLSLGRQMDSDSLPAGPLSLAIINQYLCLD